MISAMLGICLPTFVLGPLLILIFSSWLGWLPPLGWYAFSDMILPSLTLGLFYGAYIARLTRAGMLETLNQDYIRTARAKGASPFSSRFTPCTEGRSPSGCHFSGTCLCRID